MYTNLHMDHSNNICGTWLIIVKWNQNLVVRIIYTTLLDLFFFDLLVSVDASFFEIHEIVFVFATSLIAYFYILMNSFFFPIIFWMNIQMHFRVCSQLKVFFPWSYLSLPKKYFTEFKLIFQSRIYILKIFVISVFWELFSFCC